MSVSSGSYYLKIMTVFDMTTTSVTSEEFIRALFIQRAEGCCVADMTKADIEALLGLDHLNSGAPYDTKTPLKEKLL
jgi:hypothetical protein